jgi:hypothetical protein
VRRFVVAGEGGVGSFAPPPPFLTVALAGLRVAAAAALAKVATKVRVKKLRRKGFLRRTD